MKVFSLLILLFFTTTLFAQKSNYEIVKTDKEWKESLDSKTYSVMCDGSTEAPFTGKYLHNKDKGTYTCAACNNPLFSSNTKFDSGSGWPSFYNQINKKAIIEISDYTLGIKRTEIVCAKCGGHLGHVFDDGPAPTGLRYCVNSVSLNFSKLDTLKKK